jgi:hypothetical protein
MKLIKLFELIADSDFERLYSILESVRQDLEAYKGGLKAVNIMDYHWLYELSKDYENDYYNRSIKYAYGSRLRESSIYYLLPISYHEMENNINKVKKVVLEIGKKDIELIQKNKFVQEFKKAVEIYRRQPRIIGNYRLVVKSFRQAFVDNPEKKLIPTLKRVLCFLYYDKLYIHTYASSLQFFEGKQLIETSDMKKILNIESFDYEQTTYKKCFEAIYGHRFVLPSDLVDAMCYAICLNMARKRRDCLVRFITSTVPFEAFFNNDSIHNKNPCYVRNNVTMAIERYVLEKHNYDTEACIAFIGSVLETIPRTFKSENRYSRENVKLRGEIRKVFMDDLIIDIKVKTPSGKHDAFLLLIESGLDLATVITEDELFQGWINGMNEFFRKLDNLNDTTLFSQKREFQENIEAIWLLLYDYITGDLEAEIEKAKGEIESFKKAAIAYEEEGLLKAFIVCCDYYLMNDAQDWDIRGLKVIMEKVGSGYRVAKQRIMEKAREYLQKSKDENKLHFAELLYGEIRKEGGS